MYLIMSFPKTCIRLTEMQLDRILMHESLSELIQFNVIK